MKGLHEDCTKLRGYVALKEIMSENLTSPVKCCYLPLRCQSQVNFITAVLLLPFFWRKGYSSDAANTLSFPTRPVNDRDLELLFTTYILSTMTSLTAIDSTSATERRIAPFHALKDSSSGRKQFAFCFALFCFKAKLGLPPGYYGRHPAWSLTSICFHYLTTVTILHFPPRASASYQNHLIMVES